MHDEAFHFVAGVIRDRHFTNVVEIGGRWINGGVRTLFTADAYTSLDLHPGENVDVVADCRDWKPETPADLVLCLEVLEHAPDWRGVVDAAASYLAPGGLLVLTCAGPGRAPHSGHDGGTVLPGEHYANVEPADLRQYLEGFIVPHLTDVVVHQVGPDVYATAVVR